MNCYYDIIKIILFGLNLSGVSIYYCKVVEFITKSRVAHKKQLAKRPHVKHMTRSWRVMPDCQVHECFVRRDISQSNRETFCLEKSYVVLPNFLPTLYIPSLPTNCKECFSKRKHWQIHLRVRDCYTHNHIHISLWFSSTPMSSSLDLKRLLAQTLITPILSVKWDFGVIEKY